MEIKKILTPALLLIGLSLGSLSAQSQSKALSIEQATQLALENHTALKIAQDKIDIGKQKVDVARLSKLPSINFSANAFYLSDAMILDGSWSKVGTAEMPHFGNNFALQATQLLYKGGLVQKAVKAEELQSQLATFDFEKNKQDIKFLVISNYLDLIRLQNQKKIYLQNKELAELRTKNVRKFYDQGMLTYNELIRAELLIKNLDQAIITIDNNLHILNYQLNIALGLTEGTIIVPTSQNLAVAQENNKAYYKQLALGNNPLLKISETNISLAKKSIEITKTDRAPSLALFSGYNMQRPVLNTSPAIDVYSNTYQFGLSLSYSLDNLYKTKTRVKQGQYQLNMANNAKRFQEENIDTELEAGYVKYKESIQQASIFNESRNLAKANYHIVEAKYLNQLAVIADMIDATNAKLEAELQYSNAEVNIQFQYYKLIKSTGTL